MRMIKKIGVFAFAVILLCSFLCVNVFATDSESASGNDTVTEGESSEIAQVENAKSDGKLDMDLKPESFSERLEYALQGTATGMLMIFAVLALLAVILYGSKYVFYDIPNKAKENKRKVNEQKKITAAEPAPAKVTVPAAESAPAPTAQDDGELAAVITAAIAAMIEGGDDKNEFVGGFRVVSFKRSTNTAWNRK